MTTIPQPTTPDERKILYAALYVDFRGDTDKGILWLNKAGMQALVDEYKAFASEAEYWYEQALRSLLTKKVLQNLLILLDSDKPQVQAKAVDLVLSYFKDKIVSQEDTVDQFLRDLKNAAKK